MRVGGGGRHEAHGKLPTAVPVCSWTCHDLTDTLGTTGGKDYIRKFQWGPFEHEENCLTMRCNVIAVTSPMAPIS